jgi:hypothetical protein
LTMPSLYEQGVEFNFVSTDCHSDSFSKCVSPSGLSAPKCKQFPTRVNSVFTNLVMVCL